MLFSANNNNPINNNNNETQAPEKGDGNSDLTELKPVEPQTVTLSQSAYMPAGYGQYTTSKCDHDPGLWWQLHLITTTTTAAILLHTTHSCYCVSS